MTQFVGMFKDIGTGLVKGAAARNQAEYQQGSLELQAKQANVQARDAIEQGNAEVESIANRSADITGKQEVGYASGNIDTTSGSAARVIASSKANASKDISTAHTNAIKAAWGYKLDAAMARTQAQAIDKDRAGRAAYMGVQQVDPAWFKTSGGQKNTDTGMSTEGMADDTPEYSSSYAGNTA